MAAIYPATTFQEAVELTIEAANQQAQVVRGDANTEVTVEDGSTIPSIRKAQTDSMYFKEPEAWTTGQTETDYLQLKKYINPVTSKESWWFAKSAMVSNPVAMGTSPFGDDNWTLYTPEDLFISGKAEYESVYQALKGKAAEAGYNLVRGSFEEGGTLTNTDDILWYQADGKYYSWAGAFPKVVAAGATPATSGGIGAGAWVDRSDAALRSDLAGDSGAGLVGFQQAGSGSVPRTSQDKMRETVSVNDFGGATTATDNSAAFSAAQMESEVVQVPRGSFSIGTTAPDFNIAGAGKVVANGVEVSAKEVSYNPEYEIFAHTPKDYKRAQLGITYPPPPFATAPGTQKSYRTVFSLGSQLGDPNKLAGYVTAFGNFNGANMNQWFAVDAFGGDTLMYAYNVERTVAVGSEALAWFGAPSYDYLVEFKHDWFRKPTGNPYLPGDPLWNPNGLASIFPTLSAEIGNYTGYATSTADACYTTAIGRDAGNHTIKGKDNVFVGYGSGQDLFAGDQNTAVGSLSLQGAVFANRVTAIGREAGRYCKDSDGAVFVGHGSGRTVQNATNSVFVGVRAGDGVVDGVGAVVIGAEAGKDHATLNNVLAISNAGLATRKPLIGGRFDVNYAGVNADPALMRAKWHVRNADSGSTLTPAVGVLVEGVNQASVTVETGNTGYGSLRFSDPESIYSGGVEYSHSSDSLNFSANGAPKVRIEASGNLIPFPADNAQSLGKTANRWSIVYAGTGIINTSDSREKTAPLPIDDAVLDAWGDVQLITFKWLESIRLKGEDGARWHFGVIAQQVRDAFAAHGVDGTRYGLLCYDEWGDEFEPVIDEEGNDTGEQRLVLAAGNRWGIRADQCLFLEAAYQRRNHERLLKRVEALEAKV